MRILNLTQHAPTEEQIAAGVFEPDADAKDIILDALTFPAKGWESDWADEYDSDGVPNRRAVETAADVLGEVAESHGVTHAMIGGAPWLMSTLERNLRGRGIVPLYSFSVRESIEATMEDGAVRKVSVFRHRGFIEAP